MLIIINKINMNKTLLFLQIYVYLLCSTTAQPNLHSRVCQDTFGNYTSNSRFQTNLKTLLSNITSPSNINYGFSNMSVGKNFDIVNGIGLCRPDQQLDECSQCLQEAATALVEQCPNQKDAIGWYDACMIRYSDRYIFGKMELGPWFHSQSNVFGADQAKLNHTAAHLLAKLQTRAASGNSQLKYAADTATADTANVSSNLTIFGLVQCTPDLSYLDCYNCLDNAISFGLTNLYGRVAMIFYTSCNIRYESFAFVDSTKLISLKSPSPHSPPALAGTPPSSTQTSKGRSKKSEVLIVVLVPVITLFLLLFAFIACYIVTRRNKAGKRTLNGDEIIRNPKSLQMDFETIRVATENFSLSNKLGQGGFGAVFKGRLANGQEIAVKRLSKNSGQGEEEFKNEVLLIAKLRHRNLVKFLGFCLEREERLLIYELLPNKSLDYFLFDPIKRSLLDWQTRYKIIRGIARGLLYLHEDSRLLVVHRDLKAGNVLLDEKMNPKISDFGMARLFGVEQTRGNTKRICGTYGYMPPEYVQQGQFSIKSDVYSFGVLLLETISGKRISSFSHPETGENLLSFAWRNWLEDTALNIADQSMSIVDETEVLKCIHISLLCVQENFTHRPSVSTVTLLLDSQYTNSPSMPSRPAFLLDNNDDNEVAFSDESKNEATLSELDPR
ncbi:hypothetical protein RND81_07G133100 [Saponaria officinalis]|uniref:Cysteine-rich receptor-like protein kinase 10 n=1 Tax=Saponaria officinalis TaxID=3572 RepID=A0AAW1JS38_SAPOF